MADGRKRPGPPEDSSSNRTKQRFSLPNFPGTGRRNMKKAIAGVLVVLGMLLTPGALHESTWPGCFPLRSSGMFAHVCCVTTGVTAGVVGGGLALWLGYQKSGKKIPKVQTTALDNNATFFHGNPGKNEEIYEITSPIRTALTPSSAGS